MAPPNSVRDLLQLAQPSRPWRKKDMEAIEARLSRVGITSLQELQIAVRGKTLAEMLQRSGKPLSQEVLSALVAAAEGLVDGSLGELPRDRTKEEFPRMHGLSHIRRSPRWTFNQSSDFERRFLPPGPGAYHLDPRADAMDAVSRYQKGPIFSFGLSGRDPVGKQKIPGPGAYELAKEAGLTASKWTMTPRRERQKVGDVGDLPGPGDYEIEAMVGKSPKYSAGQKIDIGKKQVLPGPGDYSQGDITASKTPSWRFGTSNRPNGAAEMTPGPGAYMVSSTVGDAPCASLKGRHNGIGRPSPMPGPGAHGGHYSSFG
ncbi:unnamed protein product [Durusdinium trenchii]|uniref:Uncharacterized protein n=2 Tax=Durusdinium trenchii TaxID=1381693 RepID=A0ABP0QL06_9DINO